MPAQNPAHERDHRQALTRRRFLLGLGAAAAATTLAGCGDADPPATPSAGGPDPSRAGQRQPAATPPAPSEPPRSGWRPSDEEIMPQAKTLAAEVAELLGGSAPGADALAVLRAAGMPLSSDLAARQQPLPLAGLPTSPEATALVRYAQLGGLVPLAVTATYASVMVLLEQSPRDERDSLVRTVDVRLRVTDGAWAVDDIASVGGDPVPRPKSLPAAAVEVLDHSRIGLADSARWDIHAGRIDERLLQVMTALAAEFTYDVTVLASGHPQYIIDGMGENRTSSHTRGLALDIWAVDGRPVREQSKDLQSPARRLLEAAHALPALAKIGAPLGWDLDGATSRVFDDPVHEDHFHLALR